MCETFGKICQEYFSSVFAIRQNVGETICKGAGIHKLGVIIFNLMEEGSNL